MLRLDIPYNDFNREISCLSPATLLYPNASDLSAASPGFGLAHPERVSAADKSFGLSSSVTD